VAQELGRTKSRTHFKVEVHLSVRPLSGCIAVRSAPVHPRAACLISASAAHMLSRAPASAAPTGRVHMFAYSIPPGVLHENTYNTS
jgi:hypothetical protein